MRVFSFVSDKCCPRRKCRKAEDKYTSYYDLVLSTILKDTENTVDMDTQGEPINYRAQVQYPPGCKSNPTSTSVCVKRESSINGDKNTSTLKEGLLMYARVSNDDIGIKQDSRSNFIVSREEAKNNRIMSRERCVSIPSRENFSVSGFAGSIGLDSSNCGDAIEDICVDEKPPIVDASLRVVGRGAVTDKLSPTFILNMDRMLKEKAEIANIILQDQHVSDRGEEIRPNKSPENTILPGLEVCEASKQNDSQEYINQDESSNDEIAIFTIQQRDQELESTHSIGKYSEIFPSIDRLVWGGWRNDENLESLVIDFC